MHGKGISWLERFFSEILDLSSECLESGTFPASRKESHKSAHRFQQGRLLVMIILWLQSRKALFVIKSSSLSSLSSLDS